MQICELYRKYTELYTIPPAQIPQLYITSFTGFDVSYFILMKRRQPEIELQTLGLS